MYTDRVENLQEEVLTEAIYNLIPVLDGHKIRNKLLDGTLHIQTIGNPLKLVSLKIVSNGAGVEKINNAEFIGEPLKIFYDGDYYIGMIDSIKEWQEELFGEKDTRLYSTNIIVAVSEEGIA